ncbi:hypothetical protein UK23_24820 [Lentzea aerocolonigenes]|uniref:Ricin B lectin domain-containing protein n=2 Tax=Lentzea aerocolonigenes TaxID=68170 RepID=A0A0F0GWJ7_LENAE|nr:hypothetical protein UK23_24820 [Lentzea aerocolonigenes]
MLRRVASAGAAIAALGAMLIAPASASAASTASAAPDVVSASPGWVYIRHASSRLCLTAVGSGGVQLMDCQDLSAQKWYHFTGESNFDKFMNGFDTACLGSNGQDVFTMGSCNTPSSRWLIPGTSPKLIRHGVEQTKCLHTNSGGPGKWGYLASCGDSTRWSFETVSAP